jgi:hypothetical protein
MKPHVDPLCNRIARGAHRLDDVLGPIDMKRFSQPTACSRAVTPSADPVRTAGAQLFPLRPRVDRSTDRYALRSVWAGAGAAAASCAVVLGSFGLSHVSTAVAANRVPASGLVSRPTEVVTPPMTTAVLRVAPRPSYRAEAFVIRIPDPPQTITGSTAQQLRHF